MSLRLLTTRKHQDLGSYLAPSVAEQHAEQPPESDTGDGADVNAATKRRRVEKDTAPKRKGGRSTAASRRARALQPVN